MASLPVSPGVRALARPIRRIPRPSPSTAIWPLSLTSEMCPDAQGVLANTGSAQSVTVGRVGRSVILALAITAAAVAAVPILAYPFPRRPNWLDPYANRYARWTVYLGGAVALALFIALS